MNLLYQKSASEELELKTCLSESFAIETFVDLIVKVPTTLSLNQKRTFLRSLRSLINCEK